MVAASADARAHRSSGGDQVRMVRATGAPLRAPCLRRSGATFGPEPRYAYGLIAAVTVSSSPALVRWAWPPRCRSWLALGVARRAGVLIKNAEALERMEKVDTLVVDKTGHAYRGQAEGCCRRYRAEGNDEKDVLRFAASLERASEHPLAAAIVAAARTRGIVLPTFRFHSPTGKGVTGDGRRPRVTLGNANYLDGSTSTPAPLQSDAERLRQDGATAFFVAIETNWPASSPSPIRSRRRPKKR